MPIYEYYCCSCNDTFENLRPAPQADKPIACPTCHQPSSQRVLSLFASSVKTEGGSALPSMPAAAPMMGGGCCGGSCGCHH